MSDADEVARRIYYAWTGQGDADLIQAIATVLREADAEGVKRGLAEGEALGYRRGVEEQEKKCLEHIRSEHEYCLRGHQRGQEGGK